MRPLFQALRGRFMIFIVSQPQSLDWRCGYIHINQPIGQCRPTDTMKLSRIFSRFQPRIFTNFKGFMQFDMLMHRLNWHILQ